MDYGHGLAHRVHMMMMLMVDDDDDDAQLMSNAIVDVEPNDCSIAFSFFFLDMLQYTPPPSLSWNHQCKPVQCRSSIGTARRVLVV